MIKNEGSSIMSKFDFDNADLRELKHLKRDAERAHSNIEEQSKVGMNEELVALARRHSFSIFDLTGNQCRKRDIIVPKCRGPRDAKSRGALWMRSRMVSVNSSKPQLTQSLL